LTAGFTGQARTASMTGGAGLPFAAPVIDAVRA
jgi:hypothetical protein